MKTNHTVKAILTALLLGTGLYGARAASLLQDGDFNSLLESSAPDLNTPAGHWFWPADYLTTGEGQGSLGETSVEQICVFPAPAGGTGLCLRLFIAATASPGTTIALPNFLGRSVTKASGEILNVSFDIYVEPGRGGGAVHLGKGLNIASDRGPQLMWYSSGELITRNVSLENITLMSSYPRGVWQTVRLKVDLANDRFNFYWSEKGQPISVIHTNLLFRSGSIPSIDRFTIARLMELPETRDAYSYFDNIRVSVGDSATVVPGESFALPGGGLILGLTNAPDLASTYQWQLNGTDLPGATGPTLALSNLTLNDSGPYGVTISNAYEVVTTAPATVQVVDRVTITSDPRGTNAPAGSNVTLRVTALSPLPITYQWQFNGTNLVNGGSVSGATTANLSLSNVQLAHDGAYTVVATDAIRSVTSAPATLNVLIKPVIVQAPLSQSVVAGGSVTFSTEITGDPAPFLYQWRQGSSVLTNMMLSEKKAFFTLTNVQTNQAGLYRVVITNPASPTVSVNASWNLTVLPDADGDGLPDAWETAHALNPADASDALADADGDGQSNLAEYRSGTSPTNATSLLKLETMTQVNGGATVSFNAVSNQTYTVEWCAQPAGGIWFKLADVLARPNNRTEIMTDTNTGDSSRFYRVIAPRQP